ncbi:hypothetical protein DTO006G1_9824 [Penicillium roqueforti]|nr:hypothetical protein CBS147337_9969 [Penicillium roqueforti]KAI2750850.1 hypothetical protein DTO006G1_9824 [Penicillium roqueforti]
MVTILPLLALAVACAATFLPGPDLPVVDLGYELHQAISFNSTYGLYNFSNIRYAAPPVGDRRWKVPIPPTKNREKVQDGSVGRVCPGALPLWAGLSVSWLDSYANNKPVTVSTNVSSYPYTPPPQDGRTTEDCLFLDIIVPKTVFDRTNHKRSNDKNLAPVMVWLHGGGQTSGEKAQYDASGLIQRSLHDDDGIVFVEINYRLGAFGWLAGDHKSDVMPNLGLHDQRLALKWINDNIHLFGGDGTQVTVIGESAGGMSIIHQITAYGGLLGQAPFQQAIIQSGGWVPVITKKQQNATLKQFLDLLGVKTIKEARKLPSDKLIAANAFQVYYSPWATFTYGPVVDNNFIPDFAWRLLLEGKFDEAVNVMMGHNSNEGLLFTNPDSRNSDAFLANLLAAAPISLENAKYIAEVLYPPIYDGSHGYKDPVQRVALFTSEWALNCYTDDLRRANNNETYAYQFSIPPGLHAQDVPYTFYQKGSTLTSILFNIPVSNVTVALAMQDWFTSFALHGSPYSDLAPEIRVQGPDARLMDIGQNSFNVIHDPNDNPRCRFWQTVPYIE